MSQICKTVIIGDSGVGKTCIIQRFTKGTFNEEQAATVGASFVDCAFKLPNNESYKLRIWDTCGQESFQSIIPMYFRNASCIILVFDVSNFQSFKGIKSWLSIALSSAPESTPVVVLGSKSDLPSVVPESTINDFVRQRNYLYFPVSSKNNTGIKEAFDKISTLAFEKQSSLTKEQEIRINDEVKQSDKKCC
ncbi:hypothetical protein ENUP19_0304G0041 [Entamoeba nuttalli]|uniref:Rab family GTPase n=2 Tax=Entamoeba nuttalli TaxID=412467 RepID=K2G6U4_ENTNP|nr:Rab family GTPase [Entamoeba nuttalli P19]EKE38096.1 Rab family GTPase [Entamoeba nuttalli P19]|eukprot:XP_008859567.1 Rab family GTPase [Entamoeba nuttalli P19]